MSGWLLWASFGLLAWLVISFPLGAGIGRLIRVGSSATARLEQAEPLRPVELRPADATRASTGHRRVLLVDDESSFRELLHTTLAQSDLEVREAESAEEAAALVEHWRPSVVVLDVGLPGIDGLSFCRRLKEEPDPPSVVLLTGAELSPTGARVAGADAFLRKPFSPLELVGVLDRLLGREAPAKPLVREARAGEQLNLYARDMSELLARERANRIELEQAYRQTICSLARALEWKDAITGGHALRVRQYALELAAAAEPGLLDEPSLEAGFLLHDIGKIAIPDSILRKRGPLSPSETDVMRRHPVIGSDLLTGIPLLEGEGLGVVRSHHERWDGAGYPDGLAGEETPAGARIFAVADALDAMTSDRPYRRALPWEVAAQELAEQSGRHFDPAIVEAFQSHDTRLEGLYEEFSRRAA